MLELNELYSYFYDLKKYRENVKVWTAVDKEKNKVIAYQVSKDSDNTENTTCGELLNDVIYNNNQIIVKEIK